MPIQSSQSNPSRWEFLRYWKFPLHLLTDSSATNMRARDIVYLIRQACYGIAKRRQFIHGWYGSGYVKGHQSQKDARSSELLNRPLNEYSMILIKVVENAIHDMLRPLTDKPRWIQLFQQDGEKSKHHQGSWLPLL